LHASSTSALFLASTKSISASFMLSEIILLSDPNNLLLIWFWAMSVLSKRQSFSFLLGLGGRLLAGAAFLPASFLVLEALLVQGLDG
jgi:hypothetical protein